jgi:hypothetical protein
MGICLWCVSRKEYATSRILRVLHVVSESCCEFRDFSPEPRNFLNLP